MKFYTDEGIEFDVFEPDVDSDNWTVVQQESIEFNKGEFILEEFAVQFPHIPVVDYDQLCSLASRSKKLSLWLASANVKYSDMTQLPLFLKDKVSPKEFIELQRDIQGIKKVVADGSQKRLELAEKYKADLKAIEAEEEKVINKLTENNKIVYVLTLNSQYLPLSLQMMIEDYNPTASGVQEESRKVYGRELLIQYKSSLIDLVLEYPDIDIKAVAESNELK